MALGNNMTEGITKGQVLRYMLTPQILPRLHSLIGTRFSSLAFLVAQVYAAVNILPANHPLFLPENRENLQLHKVIALALAELRKGKNNIDQIIVFIAIIAGMILLAAQLATMLAFIMVNPALASSGNMPDSYGGFFTEPTEHDVAYQLLFALFGVPELFKPFAEDGVNSAFHTALHGLFQFYSIGLLVVAAIIICYFIFAVVVETAQTGVPFGKRYNHVWTPIRLVVALGLLVPTGYGLNSAQWITLYAAKFGSDFATRGWIIFVDTMNESYLENPEERVGTPKNPDVTNLLSFMTVAVTCKATYQEWMPDIGDQIQAYVINQSAAENSAGRPPTLGFIALGMTFLENVEDDILIRFGVHDPKKYPEERHNIFPFCGDLVIRAGDNSDEGSYHVQKGYTQIVFNLWSGEYYLDLLRNTGKHFALRYPPPDNDEKISLQTDYKERLLEDVNKEVSELIKQGVELQATSERWEEGMDLMRDRGWGGAGIWYNRIAQINGSLVTAVYNLPEPRAEPDLMRYVRQQSMQQNMSGLDALSGTLAGHREIIHRNTQSSSMANAMRDAHDDWRNNASQGVLGAHSAITGNFFIDTINLIFGTQGLFAMCQNTDTHPLAQLSQLGKGLVEATVRNIAIGAIFSVGNLFEGAVGQIGGAVSGIMFSIATMTITMGFILYYVLPFFPFLYFFFAVAGWVKGLFEAMIGVPLWALSFLRIDGDGLTGNPGMQGAGLILEVFLRPVLIVFGMLSSIIIFAALVKVLNEIYFLVVQNVAGHDPLDSTMCGATPAGGGTGDGGTPPTGIDFFRGPIDELFFTIMYAIIVYLIAMSCFKLIDLIPNNILRFMGLSVQTFNDKSADPAEGLMMRLSVGGSLISSRILGGGGEGVVAGFAKGMTGVGKGAAQLGRTE